MGQVEHDSKALKTASLRQNYNWIPHTSLSVWVFHPLFYLVCQSWQVTTYVHEYTGKKYKAQTNTTAQYTTVLNRQHIEMLIKPLILQFQEINRILKPKWLSD